MFRQYLRQADHNLSFANKTLQYPSYKIYLVSKLEGGREWDFKFRTYSQNEQKSLLLSYLIRPHFLCHKRKQELLVFQLLLALSLATFDKNSGQALNEFFDCH